MKLIDLSICIAMQLEFSSFALKIKKCSCGIFYGLNFWFVNLEIDVKVVLVCFIQIWHVI